MNDRDQESVFKARQGEEIRKIVATEWEACKDLHDHGEAGEEGAAEVDALKTFEVRGTDGTGLALVEQSCLDLADFNIEGGAVNLGCSEAGKCCFSVLEAVPGDEVVW